MDKKYKVMKDNEIAFVGSERACEMFIRNNEPALPYCVFSIEENEE